MSLLQNEENSRHRSAQGKSSEESMVSLIIDMLNGEGKKFCTGCAVWVQGPRVLGWSKELFGRGLCMCDLVWCLLWYFGYQGFAMRSPFCAEKTL